MCFDCCLVLIFFFLIQNPKICWNGNPMHEKTICLLFLVNLWQAILEAAIQQAAFKFKFRIRNLSFQGVGG